MNNVPFKGGFKITQPFNANPDSYKPYGFEGHEGLDIIPLDGDWDVYAVDEGIVVRDVDEPRNFGAYGNLVVVWNQKKKLAWWYAHNSENEVEPGDVIKRGQRIAYMGTTGNSTGPHLHLGARYSNEEGMAINLDNGHKGFVDPLPLLEDLENPPNIELKDREIDYLDFEGHTHTVGWYVREWEIEKKNAERFAGEIAKKNEDYERLQETLSKVNEANTGLLNDKTKWEIREKNLETEITELKGSIVSLEEAIRLKNDTQKKLNEKNVKLSQKLAIEKTRVKEDILTFPWYQRVFSVFRRSKRST